MYLAVSVVRLSARRIVTSVCAACSSQGCQSPVASASPCGLQGVQGLGRCKSPSCRNKPCMQGITTSHRQYGCVKGELDCWSHVDCAASTRLGPMQGRALSHVSATWREKHEAGTARMSHQRRGTAALGLGSLCSIYSIDVHFHIASFVYRAARLGGNFAVGRPLMHSAKHYLQLECLGYLH